MNLYLFRNLISNKVIVSPIFNFPQTALKQIRGNAASKPRPDHHVPLAVVTGLNLSQQSHLYKVLIENSMAATRGFLGKKYTNLPLKPSKIIRQESSQLEFDIDKAITDPRLRPWRVSKEIKQSVRMLCTALIDLIGHQSEITASESGSVQIENGNQKKEEQIVIHWERDEFQLIDSVESLEMPQTAFIEWPPGIVHQRLVLLRNRYPVVPGFSTKNRIDINIPPSAPPAPSVPSKAAFMHAKLSNKSTWKRKNKPVPVGETLHRYASRGGKSYPVLKTTAKTSRFRMLREESREKK